MTNEERQITPQQQSSHNDSQTTSHPLATGLGAVGGGVAGAAIGRSIGGKVGAAIGGVAGAITGGVAGNKLAEYAGEFIEELQPTTGLGLGADHKPVELPRHYSWEELKALSKPEGGAIQLQLNNV
ncbi:colicin V family bacteriocin [Nostoc sp. FACHB-280]|uniref:colicin V family bacteriocin n=1 Tax=Nostoc sp. FACHB-280 TaxID=2692839 RepID=UPI00168BC687|nr:colicin V family bacteriocin [Nostoc sp. FACHB-280]MBD2496286.1 colicin V family bacteriocin [Nostoc sp. FACHB-280]